MGARLRELWEYRELLLFLTWRDINVRYRQTVLGAAWAVLQPTLTMLLFTVVFGVLARVPSDGIPYPLFAFSGLLAWQLFAYALASSASSLVSNERLVTKVYFPRLVLPVSAVLAGLLDFAIGLAVLSAVMLYYRVWPSAAVLLLPFFLLLITLAALAVGIGLSALNVKFRDVRYTLPFLTQIWMFASPICYPSSLVPERWRPLYALNPLAGAVEGFRWSILGAPVFPGLLVLISVVVVLGGLVVSVRFFLRSEHEFADVI